MESVAGATTQVAEETTEVTEVKNDENTRVRWAKKLLEHKGKVGTGKLQAAVKAKFGKGIPPQRLAEVFGSESSAGKTTKKKRTKKTAASATRQKSGAATTAEAVSEEEATLDLSNLSMDQACSILKFLLTTKGRHFDLVIGNGTQILRRS